MKKRIGTMDEHRVLCSTFSYMFDFKSAIEDLYSIAPNGYMAIKEELLFPIEGSLKKVLINISEEKELFDILGSTADWSEGELYIIHLTQEHLNTLLKALQDQSDTLSAYWISYFIYNEIIVDIGHANHGCREQICFSPKVDRLRIQTLQEMRGFEF